MHVTPREVAGLSHLAKSMGGEVTINPHTGLPEAGFFDFLTNMLPTIAAIALAAPTGGTSLTALPETMAANVATTAATSAPGLFASMQAAPILGGMATGAAVAGAKGEDPLMGGLMGGISGVGAPSMANAFNNMAAGVGSAANNAGGAAVQNALAATANDAPMLSQQLGMANTLASNATPSGLSSLASNAGTNLSNVGKGVGDFAMHPLDTYDKFTKAGGSGTQLALGVGLPALQAMQPEPYDSSLDEAKRKAEENKYRDPRTGLLNLAQASPGLRLATGGTVNTNQSSITTGGLQDLYGSNDNTTGAALSKDGYGIGRLANLAAQGSIAKAQDTFYADGGPIAFADGGIFELEAAKGGYLNGAGDGMSDSIPGTIEGKQPARLADGEFVIPADVVSHLGNGSSKAGSKRLYDMMHKVRKARTGNPKQGKEINPNQYMPA
jgi:hypothetical protein